jgi:hypothetical protein
MATQAVSRKGPLDRTPVTSGSPSRRRRHSRRFARSLRCGADADLLRHGLRSVVRGTAWRGSHAAASRWQCGAGGAVHGAMARCFGHGGMTDDDVVIPDLPEPITAWRVWNVRTRPLVWREPRRASFWPEPEALQLVGWFGQPWSHATKRAQCLSPRCRQCNPDDRSPHAWGSNEHPCGIYTLRTRELAAARSDRSPMVALGRVTIWGRVWEHADGYRSEWCRIDALTVAALVDTLAYRPEPAITARLCATYNVVPLEREMEGVAWVRNQREATA